MNENIAKKMQFGSYLNFLFSAKFIRLNTLAKFAVDGGMGDLKDYKVISIRLQLDMTMRTQRKNVSVGHSIKRSE